MNKHEFLIFKLGKEEYAVDIQKVQEIRNYETPTLIADQPKHVKGIINLRGELVTILDLRMKFKDTKIKYDNFTVVIILNYAHKTVGIVVDAVSDVLILEDSNIQSGEHIEKFSDISYLKGIGIIEDRMLQIIEINNFISELGKLENQNITIEQEIKLEIKEEIINETDRPIVNIQVKDSQVSIEVHNSKAAEVNLIKKLDNTNKQSNLLNKSSSSEIKPKNKKLPQVKLERNQMKNIDKNLEKPKSIIKTNNKILTEEWEEF